MKRYERKLSTSILRSYDSKGNKNMRAEFNSLPNQKSNILLYIYFCHSTIIIRAIKSYCCGSSFFLVRARHGTLMGIVPKIKSHSLGCLHKSIDGFLKEVTSCLRTVLGLSISFISLFVYNYGFVRNKFLSLFMNLNF